MAAQKKDIINAAARELRISGLTSSLEPEETSSFLYELENMMAQMLENGQNIGYVFTETPDPSDDLGVPRNYWTMLATRLAVHLAPTYGDSVPSPLMAKARQAYRAFMAAWNKHNLQEVVPSRRMPLGSGSNRWGNRYNRYARPQEQVSVNSSDKVCIVVDGVTDSYIDFSDWVCREFDDAISSFDIKVDGGLTLQSSGQTDNRVEFRVKASNANTTLQRVQVSAISDSGRVTTRYKEFVIQPKRVS